MVVGGSRHSCSRPGVALRLSFGLRTIPSGAPGDQTAPTLAFDGSNYLVVWQDEQPTALFDIFGVRISPGGTSSTKTPSASRGRRALSGTRRSHSAEIRTSWTGPTSGTARTRRTARVSRRAAGCSIPAGSGSRTKASFARVFPRGMAYDGSNFIVPWWWSRIASPVRRGDRSHARDTGWSPCAPCDDDQPRRTAHPTPPVTDDRVRRIELPHRWYDYRAGNEDVYGGRVTPGNGHRWTRRGSRSQQGRATR